ncbi:hypothetical protein [Arundinibacter roseus]|uniref:Uncharacterized protein n=1 Tax=Arundinibacter roseus TaxID=2070510 RepID=A0A4R4JYW9_9BACT|nr:hypothetical protein [Arundinibacter roseus]TDB60084.1 hypothetical protein EZE20_21675 [Arundinibacter roseus]
MKQRKYVIMGVPKEGIGHCVPGFGFVKIHDQLQDKTIDALMTLGFTRYFKLNTPTKSDEQNSASTKDAADTTHSGGRASSDSNTDGSGGINSGAGTIARSGSTRREPESVSIAGSATGAEDDPATDASKSKDLGRTNSAKSKKAAASAEKPDAGV